MNPRTDRITTADRDVIRRFSFLLSPIRGQWVRLDAVLDELDRRRRYPPHIRRLVGEMLAAVTLVADNVKFKGAVSLQSRGSGPLTTVLAECRERRLLRGLARWREDAAVPDSDSLLELLGDGRLALNLIPENEGAGRSGAYQGLVAVTEPCLAENLESYFANSEQLPTRLLFASAGGSVTGLLLQRLPAPDGATEIELDRLESLWSEVLLLAGTLAPEELAELDCETLIRRLFGENTMRLHPPRDVAFECTCNRSKTSATLLALGRDELLALLEERGDIHVTCEICGEDYRYDAVDVHLLLSPDAPRIH